MSGEVRSENTEILLYEDEKLHAKAQNKSRYGV